MAQGSVGLDVLWGDVAMQRLCDRVPEAAGRTVVRPYPQSEIGQLGPGCATAAGLPWRLMARGPSG